MMISHEGKIRAKGVDDSLDRHDWGWMVGSEVSQVKGVKKNFPWNGLCFLTWIPREAFILHINMEGYDTLSITMAATYIGALAITSVSL
jgi:hypothetical protein